MKFQRTDGQSALADSGINIKPIARRRRRINQHPLARSSADDNVAHRMRQPVLWRGDAFGLAPLLLQFTTPARIPCLGNVEGDDAIGAEMPDRAAQLAPGGDDANAIEVAERERPDRAFG